MFRLLSLAAEQNEQVREALLLLKSRDTPQLEAQIMYDTHGAVLDYS